MSQAASVEERNASLSDSLPISALLALAMSGFISILTETLPAGLLLQISVDLGVSESLAGQTVTVYAIGSIVAAIPLTIATQSWQRRTLLIATIAGILIFNTITAFSPYYGLTLAARFFAGIAAGLSWSLLAGYARRMVAPQQQGRALALAMVGTPMALSLGVPLGTWLGNLIGWRSTFGIMSALTVVLIVWVLFKVPDYPGQTKTQRLPLRRVLKTPGVRPVLAVIVAWMLAHNILYTYIAPFVTPAGLSQQVDLVLLVFGVAALAGIWVISLLVDRWLRTAVLFSLGGFSLIAIVLGWGGAQPTVVVVSVGVWGLTFGGAATLLQTALADSAGDGADIAQSMCVTVWNLAIAGGGIIGGVLLGTRGVTAFPWAVLALLLLGWLVARASHQHGFKPGARPMQ